MVDKLEPRAILAKAYRDNGDMGAANYIEAGHDLLPDTQIHLLAIRDALEARAPANGEQVERVARAMCDRVNGQGDYDANPERHAGWNAQARAAITAMNPTPTEDARERVKVLEEAARPIVAKLEHSEESFARYRATHPDEEDMTDEDSICVSVADVRALRAALGNKETDRHG